MLTKGIIQSINLASNKCIVRIPIFETAGNIDIFTADAVLTVLPGVYNGFKVGDVVIVGFGAGGAGDCVVLGKLYLGVQAERTNEGGSVHCSDFIASNSASLPANTIINFYNASTNISPLSTYKSLGDLAKAVVNNTNSITELTSQKKLVSKDAKVIGYWLNDEIVWQQTVNITNASTILESIQASLCWLDPSSSFIKNTNNNSTRLITNCNITITANKNIQIDLGSLQLTETAYLTLCYIK